MKPQDEFAVIVAGVVTASVFELLNTAGQVVAQLGGIAGGNRISFLHLDPAMSDSYLEWTTYPLTPTGRADLNIRGPVAAGVGLSPVMQMRKNVFGQAEHSVTIYTGYVDVGGSQAAISLVGYPTSTGPIDSTIGLDAKDITIQAGDDLQLTAFDQFLMDSNNLDIDAATFDVTGTTSSIVRGGNVVEGASNGGWTVQHNSAGYYQIINPNIYMGYGGGGRAYVQGKALAWPLSLQQLDLAASTAVGFRSFLINGITTPTGQVGDVYVITLSARVLCTVAGGAWIGEIQGFGGGFGVNGSRCIATNWAVNHDASIAHTWTLTQTVAGAVSWAIVGGSTGGTWNLIAPDSSFSVTHYTF